MFKDFKSKFSILCEEATTRFNQSGVLVGDYCVIKPEILKSEFLKNKPSIFADKIKEKIKSDLPLKIASVKSSRPESSNDLVAGAGNAFIGTFVDVITCMTPATWVDPITLPVEFIDVVIPDGQNWSPANPESWKRRDDSQIEPIPVKDVGGETEHQTQGSKRKLATKDTKGIGKSAKDGRSQVKKPVKQ
jgi:hypothetical protein